MYDSTRSNKEVNSANARNRLDTFYYSGRMEASLLCIKHQNLLPLLLMQKDMFRQLENYLHLDTNRWNCDQEKHGFVKQIYKSKYISKRLHNIYGNEKKLICWHLNALPTTPYFLGKVGLNLASRLVTCCWLGWGFISIGWPPSKSH